MTRRIGMLALLAVLLTACGKTPPSTNAPTPTRTRGPRLSTITRTVEAATVPPGETPTIPLFTPALTITFMPMLLSATLPPPPASCPPPLGWSPIKIQAGDTLEGLAKVYNATMDALIQANCLVTEELIPDTILYVPGIPPTESPIHCGPPSGWVFYTVQPGDTLFRLGLAFGVSVAELQFANCLGNSTLIRAGTRIFVPNVPTRTPTTEPTQPAPTIPSPTVTPTAPPTPSPTPTPIPTMAPVAVETRLRPQDSMVMVFVPAGEFLMGSASKASGAYPNEKPQHTGLPAIRLWNSSWQIPETQNITPMSRYNQDTILGQVLCQP